MPSIGATPSMNNTTIASPYMGTPYLDSSMIDTPFMDTHTADTPPFLPVGLDFSPYLMYNAFANLNMSSNNDNKDVCVSGYLNHAGHNNPAAELTMTNDPVAQFNGDPSLLLIDKSKHPLYTPAAASITTPLNILTPASTTIAGKPSPTVKLENLSEQETDSLFPPLTSSEEQFEHSAVDQPMDSGQNISGPATPLLKLEDVLGFDPSSSPLSEEMRYSDSQFSLSAANDVAANSEEPSIEKQGAAQSEEEGFVEKINKRPIDAVGSGHTSQRSLKKVKKATTKAAEKNQPAAKHDKPKKVIKKQAKEPKLYQCHICGLISKRRYNLNTHIKTHDKNRTKDFPCPQCHKAFDRRHDRDRHLATVHRGERSFSCKHCKNHFSRRDALNRHLVQRHDYDESQLVD
ncbi:hypothetical protein BDF20DRAFT_914398 [Mycotypha africana]|uniref:uncharacterized protein n=1 Tax=Mycotypha africana TaxID=64632 RepID=UPI0023012C11|nr:uncharacterized protein BDF20DRAFT_914398 [Mycotypha africana]KAI8975473.1 hypothetical protein BDF20DRAFT_914398 [Mycotypha africana]